MINLEKDGFELFKDGCSAKIFVDSGDYWGVIRAARDLASDIYRVTGVNPALINDLNERIDKVVIIGTMGKSRVIKELMEKGKLDTEGVSGKWEASVIQTVDNPLPGVAEGLVISGSDKRGTIYGIYELSKAIGVSPWYWWADVVPEKKEKLLVSKGTYKQGEPSVKYRGIFINDEAPCLTTWVEKHFGGFNHQFYEKVFELLLRLKANYLWPAMWKPRIFNEEDPLNPLLADKYGIVMGTSHHEPMMRSWEEWSRYGTGEWNYSTNRENIYKFWEDGIERVKDYEGIITLGMRGDGDEAMVTTGKLEDNQALLEKIIADQREILAAKINTNLTEVPQLLALYKEVQSFYENGLQIPEDITLLLSDDNYGNIRMLPNERERKRSGGYGMYYHFDYVGAPRSYQWINTIPLPKIWEQMRMTYEYGVDRIWIVNVGDIKPLELPIEFFLELAWDINKWDQGNISVFAQEWAEREFGKKYALDTADIVLKYTKFNGRRKPELITGETYSLINYREAERVLAKFEEIIWKAEKVYEELPPEKKDAYFQLVLYPARASRNVLKMNISAGLNNLYAEQGRIIANEYAQLTEEVFQKEAEDSQYYNKTMSGGKWDGMMIQPHIGQEGWRGPTKNTMPAVKRIPVLAGSEMGVAVENSSETWPGSNSICNLPEYSKFTSNRYYIEIFNKKADPFEFKAVAHEPWLVLSQKKGWVKKQTRIEVGIDWQHLPKSSKLNGTIIISGTGSEVRVKVRVFNPDISAEDLEEMTFVESNGYIAMEAEHFVKNVPVNGVSWKAIPDYGRTLSALAVYPPTATSIELTENSPYLEYKVYIFNPGRIKITVYTAPGLNINRDRGLRYGISFDEQEVQVIDTFPLNLDAHHSFPVWSRGVMDNIRKTTSIHQLEKAGYHTLKFRMIDPGLVLQRIVLDMGGEKPCYLGPPESYYKGSEKR